MSKEGGEVDELRRNPRINALLVALRRIRDHAESLDVAKETALCAIEQYIDAARPSPTTEARERWVRLLAEGISNARPTAENGYIVSSKDLIAFRLVHMEMAHALWGASALSTPDAQQRWQPIETAPKDGTRIILAEGDASFQGFWDCDPEDEGGHCWREDGPDWQNCGPTHWMPLPRTTALHTRRAGEERWQYLSLTGS